MLIHQDTSPSGLASTFWISWRLVLQDFFGAHPIAGLSGWHTDNSGQPGVYAGLMPVAYCANQTISVLCCHSKEGPLQVFEAVPLYHPHYGKRRHMPPRDLERTPCRHPCGTENL
jgi:hypothetical protein